MRTTLTALALLAASSAFAQAFKPPCELPYASIAKKQSIDSDCPISGAKSSSALMAQDTAKNNFCAKGKPVVMQFGDYHGLQAAGEKVLGGPSYKPPETREALEKLHYDVRGHHVGEGTLVTIAGYVDKAHYSDVGEGEGVNCRLKSVPENDVHVPLVATSGADECTSITAEISPHYRPPAWTANSVNSPKAPLRFTGQLFFDAEHRPCTGDTIRNPKRQSVWEVHPVYAIDVCTASDHKKCDASDATVWMPLDRWITEQTH